MCAPIRPSRESARRFLKQRQSLDPCCSTDIAPAGRRKKRSSQQQRVPYIAGTELRSPDAALGNRDRLRLADIRGR